MFISEINVYPIKSLKGISLKQAKIERRGLEYDRRWMLVDEKNKFITQREFPQMATVEVCIESGGLLISANGEELKIPLVPDSKIMARVKVWSSVLLARVYENFVNDWFSDLLGTRCKLVLMPDESIRKVNYFYAVRRDDQVSFADGYPFLLIGENSLHDLNSRLETDLPMDRFRPNLVVTGAEPFAEDDWKTIKIGKTVFHIVKPCARCVITTIDQSTGEKTGQEPLKTLASFRVPKRSLKRKVLFGQNLIAENAGDIISVGDQVEVLERKNGPVFL